MNESTRRRFLKSLSILSIGVFANKEVFAFIGNEKNHIVSSPKALKRAFDIAEILSHLLGVPVVSTQDANGNWILIIGGHVILLTFYLPEVQITASGKVVSSINQDVLFGGSDEWAPPQVQQIFDDAMAMFGAMTEPFQAYNTVARKVADGMDGENVQVALETFYSANSLMVGSSEVAFQASQFEYAAAVTAANKLLGIMDIAGNLVEVISDDQTWWQRLEDSTQAVLGLAFTFTKWTPLGIGGGVFLTSWELWEYKRDEKWKQNRMKIEDKKSKQNQ